LCCRISVEGVMAHLWFREALPPGLASVNLALLSSPPDVRLNFCRQSEAEIRAVCAAACHRMDGQAYTRCVALALSIRAQGCNGG
jgi:hypothetical protein